MIQLNKITGDTLPQPIEYLGMNEWAVRWEIENVTETYEDYTVSNYKYHELRFNEEPTYDSFVTAYIRTKYSSDSEAALKSNMVEQFASGIQTTNIQDEWREFQDFRNEAKSIGKLLFKK